MRLNRAIAKLEKEEPVFYIGGHADADLSFDAGVEMAETWADYINIGFEHGPLDLPGLDQFMRGLASVRTPTPPVLVELPFEGRSADHVEYNAWIVRQLLTIGVHGFLLCHAEVPEAVEQLIKTIRYSFRGGTRGAGGQSQAARIWGITPEEYLELADPWPLNPKGELLIGLKLENRRAKVNADKTTSVPGIAFAEWGPADMSMSHGYRGSLADISHPEIQSARDQVFEACKTNGLFFLEGCTEANLAQKLQEGVRIFSGGPHLQKLASEIMDGSGS